MRRFVNDLSDFDVMDLFMCPTFSSLDSPRSKAHARVCRQHVLTKMWSIHFYGAVDIMMTLDILEESELVSS